jgi:hypothetical protein
MQLRFNLFIYKLIYNLFPFIFNFLKLNKFKLMGKEICNDYALNIFSQIDNFPMYQDRKTVFLIVTCGQAIRNFLISETYILLKSRFNLVILSPYAKIDSFREAYQDQGVHVLTWYENFNNRLELLCSYYHMETSSSSTLKSILQNIKTNHRKFSNNIKNKPYKNHYMFYRLAVLLGNALGRHYLRRMHDIVIWMLLPHLTLNKLFEAYKPALVISFVAHHNSSWVLTSFAKSKGIKILSNVISWDNITTKAMLDESSDHYALWSEEMAWEIKKYFPFINAEMHIVGSPQFDIYFNKNRLLEQTDFVATLGLDTKLPYILYTTNTPIAMPDEPDIIREFWSHLQNSELKDKVSLLIRLHPKDKIERYENLQGISGVCIRMAGPPMFSKADNWLPNQEVVDSLLNQMVHAKMIVNVASTMSLESFCLNLPTINIAYTHKVNNKTSNFLWSFDMYHTSEHYKALIQNDAVIVVRNKFELLNAVRNSIIGENSRSANMLSVLKQKVSHCDGTSSKRFYDLVNSIVV